MRLMKPLTSTTTTTNTNNNNTKQTGKRKPSTQLAKTRDNDEDEEEQEQEKQIGMEDNDDDIQDSDMDENDDDDEEIDEETPSQRKQRLFQEFLRKKEQKKKMNNNNNNNNNKNNKRSVPTQQQQQQPPRSVYQQNSANNNNGGKKYKENGAPSLVGFRPRSNEELSELNAYRNPQDDMIRASQALTFIPPSVFKNVIASEKRPIIQNLYTNLYELYPQYKANPEAYSEHIHNYGTKWKGPTYDTLQGMRNTMTERHWNPSIHGNYFKGDFGPSACPLLTNY